MPNIFPFKISWDGEIHVKAAIRLILATYFYLVRYLSPPSVPQTRKKKTWLKYFVKFICYRTSLRRIARHEEPEFSNASILNSMEKFVKTVNEMEETILVPSRLLDLAVGDSGDMVAQNGKRGATIKDTMANTDLYRLYNIVNEMKLELLWSQKSSDEGQEEEDREIEESRRLKSRPSTENVRLGHARCPSTTSMQSVQSASSIISSSSDSDSDVGIENDSGLESEEPTDKLANIAAENFRRHLRGLHRSIKRMTQAAEYLTLRYQADVGGPVWFFLYFFFSYLFFLLRYFVFVRFSTTSTPTNAINPIPLHYFSRSPGKRDVTQVSSSKCMKRSSRKVSRGLLDRRRFNDIFYSNQIRRELIFIGRLLLLLLFRTLRFCMFWWISCIIDCLAGFEANILSLSRGIAVYTGNLESSETFTIFYFLFQIVALGFCVYGFFFRLLVKHISLRRESKLYSQENPGTWGIGQLLCGQEKRLSRIVVVRKTVLYLQRRVNRRVNLRSSTCENVDIAFPVCAESVKILKISMMVFHEYLCWWRRRTNLLLLFIFFEIEFYEIVGKLSYR